LGAALEQNGDCVCMGPWLGRPYRHSLAEWILCTVVQALGGGHQSRDCAVLGSVGLGNMAQQDGAPAGMCRPWERGRQSRDHAGLGSMTQQDGAPAGLCRSWVRGPQSSCRAMQVRGVHGLVEIINVCGSLAVRAHPMEILRVWGVGVWGSTALMGQRSRAGGSEIPQRMEQRLHGPMGWGLVSSACYSFSIWCSGEVSWELGVQSADVSALPGILPHSSKSPASCQSPWITEVRRSVVVFRSPSWISPTYILKDNFLLNILEGWW
jgi:hypothetical protein